MVAPTENSQLSVPVRLELEVGDKRFSLAQISTDKIILSDSSVLPGTHGIIIAYIGENERRWGARWEESDAAREIIRIELFELAPTPA